MRNFHRSAVACHAAAILNDQHQRILIQDFSRMGVGFVADEILHLKIFMSVLYQNENQEIIQMKCYVKHARKLKDALYFVGVQFVGIETKFGRAI